MKRPEKKEIRTLTPRNRARATGYNQACDDWESYIQTFIDKYDKALTDIKRGMKNGS